MKLVILDGFACNEGDLDWNGLRALVDEVVLYPRTKYEDIIPRLQGADFAVVNKTYIDEAVLNAVPTLRWIGVTATGTDSLDIAACRRHGVPVANVPGYSTHSVAQHTFALLLDICQCPARHEANRAFWQNLWRDWLWRYRPPNGKAGRGIWHARSLPHAYCKACV